MAPTSTRHMQRQFEKQQSRHSDHRSEDVEVAVNQDVFLPPHPATTILTSQFPLYQKWESMEEHEYQGLTDSHKRKPGAVAFEPEYLPVLVHVACPQNGRFTREIQSDMVKCNSIEAVKNLVKSSLLFELIRSNIDPRRARFAGLMTYGPTKEFSTKTIHSHTRGLFLDQDQFKKWWLTVNMSERFEGDMIKIAVVLWDADEAAAKRVELPDFWTEENARKVGDMLKELEWPIWDLEFERGCRSYVQLQEQLIEAKIDAVNAMGGDWKAERRKLKARNRKLEKTLADLEARHKGLVDAVHRGDMKEAGRLVGGRESENESEKEEQDNAEEDEDVPSDGDEEMYEGEDEDEDEDDEDVNRSDDEEAAIEEWI